MWGTKERQRQRERCAESFGDTMIGARRHREGSKAEGKRKGCPLADTHNRREKESWTEGVRHGERKRMRKSIMKSE